MPPAMRHADLDRFAATIASHIDGAELDPTQVDLVAAADDGDAVEVLVIEHPDTPQATSALDQLLTSERRAAALVMPTAWSPTAHGASSPAWLLVAAAADLPAFAVVRRVGDKQWTRLEPDWLPWFALSTAAGLRAALVDGKPVRVKHDAGPEHFQRPDQQPDPPVDGHGQL